MVRIQFQRPLKNGDGLVVALQVMEAETEIPPRLNLGRPAAGGRFKAAPRLKQISLLGKEDTEVDRERRVVSQLPVFFQFDHLAQAFFTVSPVPHPLRHEPAPLGHSIHRVGVPGDDGIGFFRSSQSIESYGVVYGDPVGRRRRMQVGVAPEDQGGFPLERFVNSHGAPHEDQCRQGEQDRGKSSDRAAGAIARYENEARERQVHKAFREILDHGNHVGYGNQRQGDPQNTEPDGKPLARSSQCPHGGCEADQHHSHAGQDGGRCDGMAAAHKAVVGVKGWNAQHGFTVHEDDRKHVDQRLSVGARHGRFGQGDVSKDEVAKHDKDREHEALGQEPGCKSPAWQGAEDGDRKKEEEDEPDDGFLGPQRQAKQQQAGQRGFPSDTTGVRPRVPRGDQRTDQEEGSHQVVKALCPANHFRGHGVHGEGEGAEESEGSRAAAGFAPEDAFEQPESQKEKEKGNGGMPQEVGQVKDPWHRLAERPCQNPEVQGSQGAVGIRGHDLLSLAVGEIPGPLRGRAQRLVHHDVVIVVPYETERDAVTPDREDCHGNQQKDRGFRQVCQGCIDTLKHRHVVHSGEDRCSVNMRILLPHQEEVKAGKPPEFEIAQGSCSAILRPRSQDDPII